MGRGMYTNILLFFRHILAFATLESFANQICILIYATHMDILIKEIPFLFLIALLRPFPAIIDGALPLGNFPKNSIILLLKVDSISSKKCLSSTSDARHN